MPKRFTDTDKWKKPFVRGLEGAYKLLWLYILDDCDHAGIWQVDFEVARIRIGEPGLDFARAKVLFGERVTEIDKFKWFIPDFISFQYGELSEKNRMHQSVITILSKYNLYKPKGHTSPFQGDKDKEQDKDKEMVKEKEKEYTADFTKFELLWSAAFDQRTIENYKMQYRFVSMEEELSHFRLICDSDPPNYHQRDTAGLRQAFLYQLRNGKQKSQVKPQKQLTNLDNL